GQPRSLPAEQHTRRSVPGADRIAVDVLTRDVSRPVIAPPGVRFSKDSRAMRQRDRRTLISVLIAMMLIPGLNLARSMGAASMRWYGSIEEASTEARQVNKPMMLDFWAEWCAPCKVMEAEVYTNADFVQAAEPFFSVRINSDNKPAEARKYHVTARSEEHTS